MSARDEELKRLKKYAEGLGVKVVTKPYVRGIGAAEWNLEDKCIVLYKRPRDSKTSIILSFLHELGHHLDWIHNNNKKITQKVHNAFVKLNEGLMEGPREDLSQEIRDIIYEEEKAGIAFMETIYKELDLKIPFWKVKLQQHMDIFDYKMLKYKGRFGTNDEYDREYKSKMVKFKAKYGNKSN